MKYVKVQVCTKTSKHAKQILKALSFDLKVLLKSSDPLFYEVVCLPEGQVDCMVIV